jgi:hypothetical protein
MRGVRCVSCSAEAVLEPSRPTTLRERRSLQCPSCGASFAVELGKSTAACPTSSCAAEFIVGAAGVTVTGGNYQVAERARLRGRSDPTKAPPQVADLSAGPGSRASSRTPTEHRLHCPRCGSVTITPKGPPSLRCVGCGWRPQPASTVGTPEVVLSAKGSYGPGDDSSEEFILHVYDAFDSARRVGRGTHETYVQRWLLEVCDPTAISRPDIHRFVDARHSIAHPSLRRGQDFDEIARLGAVIAAHVRFRGIDLPLLERYWNAT